MTPPTSGQLVQSYRTLLRASLRAVQYAKPARFAVRDHLRDTFRSKQTGAFNSLKIDRTLEFLHGAAKTRGLEHKIVKNLAHVWYTRKTLPRQSIIKENLPHRNVAYEQFDRTIEKLNETMGLCIK